MNDASPSPDLSFLPVTGTSRKWNAKWVWGNEIPKNSYWLFRQRFAWNEDLPVENVFLFASAETRCMLWINGVFIGRAPKPGQPWLQYYHRFSVGSHLCLGENLLAALVYCQAEARPFTQPGFLAEIARDGKQKATLLATGSGTRVRKSTAWNENSQIFGMNHFYRFQEQLDSRHLSPDWVSLDFDDRSWDFATTISNKWSGNDRVPAAGPWARLIENQLPEMTDIPARPVGIEADECLDLINRTRSDDLSIRLSQTGTEISRCEVHDLENLLTGHGSCTLVGVQPLRGTAHDGVWDPCLLLDFGKVITAYPEIEIEGPAGLILQLGYAERLINGHFNNAIECFFADSIILRGGRQIFQPFHWKAFRYLRIRLSRHEGAPVLLHSLRARISTFPFEERGFFHSPDQELQGIWEISRHTVRLCSNEFYMDTPFREAAQWLGDVASVTLGATYACFGDARLPREFYRQTSASQHPTSMISNVSNIPSDWVNGAIPDYSLEWLIFLWDFYLYTGDAAVLEETYPQALRVMQTFYTYVNDNAFLEDVAWWVLIDWAHTDRRGECTALNALFYGALGALEKIAGVLSDQRVAGHCEKLRAAIKSNFQAAFFCRDRGCLADARIDGQLSEMHSEHASMAAIYFGLVDDSVARSILRRFYESPALPPGQLPYTAECEPFFCVFVLNALHRAGRRDLALKVIRDRWGRRMLDKGATSVFEEWSPEGSWRNGEFFGQMRSHSHAWSATPAEFLIRNLAGLEILEPGGKRVRVNPYQTDFSYEVCYPLQSGHVLVKWDGENLHTTPSDGIEVENLTQ